MKIIPLLAICFFASLATCQAAPDILRIKLDWLNAKECGFDGCKPQSVVMRPDTSMTFGWQAGSGQEARGVFELYPRLQDDSVRLRVRRTINSAPVAEDERTFALGVPQEITLKDVRLKVTITGEESKSAK